VLDQGFAPREIEILLIDNASTDDSCDLVRREFPQVRLLANPRNLGFVLAINQGLAAARGPCILPLNNDAVLQPGALRTLLDALQRGPSDLGGVQPLLLWAADPGIIDSAGIALHSPFSARDDLNGCPVAMAPDAMQEIWGTCFACALIRRDVFAEAGPLDPDFFAEWDDVDFCLRARWLGYRFQLVPQARVLHHRSPSLKRLPADRYSRLRRNQLCTYTKALPGMRALGMILYRAQRDLFMLPHHLRAGSLYPVWAFWRQWWEIRPVMRRRRRELLDCARLTPRQMSRQLRQFMRSGGMAYRRQKEQRPVEEHT